MSNFNLHTALEVGEETTTASPRIDLGPAKAVAATIATVAVSFLGALGVAITDGAVSGEEWVTIAIATILATGLVGGATFVTPAKVTGK